MKKKEEHQKENNNRQKKELHEKLIRPLFVRSVPRRLCHLSRLFQ